MSVGKGSRRFVTDLSGDSAFSGTDLRRLEETIADALLASTAPVSTLMELIAADGRAASMTERSCAFDHCAVLLFPRTLAAGLHDLERRGLAPAPLLPSTVVRRRLSDRYGLDPADCDIAITRLSLDLPDGRRHAAVELFLFPRDSHGFDRLIEESESVHGYESHTAFHLNLPGADVLAPLVTAWHDEAGLLWEGGGHNPHEGGPHGTTVLYFVRDHRRPARRRRFELHCDGDLRALTDRLPRQADAVDRAYSAWSAAGAVPRT